MNSGEPCRMPWGVTSTNVGFWVDTHRNPADAGSRGARPGPLAPTYGPYRAWVLDALAGSAESARARIHGGPLGPHGA